MGSIMVMQQTVNLSNIGSTPIPCVDIRLNVTLQDHGGQHYTVEYGNFADEQDARWFWLTIKEKLKIPWIKTTIINKKTRSELTFVG